MMEVFAGFLSHTDHHLGRLLDFLRERGDLDNTIVMVISDNGASAEGGPTGTTNEAQFFNNAPESLEDSLARIDEIGGPTTFNHYPWGWTWAGNTPFRRWKRETYRGGASDPFIVSWPQGIAARGEVRTQYAHIIDMVPTVLDVLGIEPPGHDPGRHPVAAAGRQLREDASTTPPRRATTTRSTSRCSAAGRSTTTAGGRSAPGPARRSPRRAWGSDSPSPPTRSPSSTPPAGSCTTSTRTSRRTTTSPRSNRDRLIALIGTWYVEAGRYGVMPVDGSGLQRMIAEKPQAAAPRDSYTYHPGHAVDPVLRRRRGCSTARTASPRPSRSPRAAPRASCSRQGSAAGGYSFFMQGRHAALRPQLRRPRASTGVVSRAASRPARTSSASSSSRPASRTCRTGKGRPGGCSSTSTATLVAEAEAPVTIPFVINPGALTCGANPGSPVTPDYASPFPFTGTLHSVTVDVCGELIHDPEAELRAAHGPAVATCRPRHGL